MTQRKSYEDLPVTLHRSLVGAAVAAALSIPQAARAADTQTPALQEVIVTANRREEDVLTIPYNISAVSQKQIEDAGITDVQGLTRMVPGLASADLGPRVNSTNSNLIIRGLNASDQGFAFFGPNLAVPLVSTYLDDVPLFVNYHLTDVERVEVLRGPQGTLYGSGAVGGTLRLIRHKPDLDHLSWNVSTDVSATSHSGQPSYSFDGLVNIPLTETFAVRIAGGYSKLSGFIDAVHAARFQGDGQPLLADPSDPLNSDYQYERLSDIDVATSRYARVAARWKPNNTVDVLLDYTRQQDHSGGFSAQTVGYEYETTKLIPRETLDRTVDVGSVTVSVDLGFATLTSSSSYYDNRYNDVVDVSDTEGYYSALDTYYYGGYPRYAAYNFDNSRDRSFVEEMRLVSRAGGPWDYIAGAFFRNQKSHLDDPETWPGFAAWAGLPGSAAAYNDEYGTSFNTFNDVIADRDGTIPSALSPTDLFYNNLRDTRFQDRAFYGELTRHLSDRWQVTAGARFFWQWYQQSETQVYPFAGAAQSDTGTNPLGITSSEQEKSYRNHIFKINTSYEFSRAARAYATISEGFRHGGANSFKICPPNANGSGGCELPESAVLIPYGSDTAKNYEVGLKGEINRRIRYSVSVYRVNWQDIQLDAFAPRTGIAIVVNGKDARSQGLEFEVQSQITDSLAASIGGSYTDAKLSSDFIVANFVGRSGDRLPLVPKVQLTAALDYVVPLAEKRELSFHLDGSYRSDVNTAVNDLQADDSGAIAPNLYATNFRHLGGFALFDAAMAVKMSERLKLRLYCNNITNRAGVTTWATAHDPANAFEYVMRPRTAGLGIEYGIE